MNSFASDTYTQALACTHTLLFQEMTERGGGAKQNTGNQACGDHYMGNAASWDEKTEYTHLHACMHANSNDFESPSKIIHNRVKVARKDADAMGERGKLLGKKSKGNSCLVHPAFVITVRKFEVCEGQNECWLQGQGQSHYRRHDMGVVWRTKSLMWWERKRDRIPPPSRSHDW